MRKAGRVLWKAIWDSAASWDKKATRLKGVRLAMRLADGTPL